MKLKFAGIELEREKTPLDEFVIDFCQLLKQSGIRYVIISGYVAILFGRSRSSEDVDVITEAIDSDKFSALWNKLDNSFECLNTTNKERHMQAIYHKTSPCDFLGQKSIYLTWR
ncbi:MAG: hypothetical protein HY364_02355 [Candidatus Aenigmarchaeota archaeon]|nr:hypothetical protein [Candidatus Aenigmarchaeota archaeon]